MKYTHMQVFYTVARYQNISKAALELDVTQPAVSRIIANLEKEFNVKLFYRSKEGVKLSREGLSLYEALKNPFSELDKINNDILNKNIFLQSTVHIGTTTTALYAYLFHYLDIIKNKFPNVNFRIYTGSSKELLDMVKENRIDFALITTPFKTTDDIEIFNILPLEDILIAPNSYKDKITGPVSIKDLTKYPFVLLNKDMQYREHIDEFLFSNKTKITPTYELDNSGIIINLVEYGYGLSFAPTIMAAPLLEKNKVFKIELKEEIPTRYIAFAIKKDVIYSNVIYDIEKEIMNSIKE